MNVSVSTQGLERLEVDFESAGRKVAHGARAALVVAAVKVRQGMAEDFSGHRYAPAVGAAVDFTARGLSFEVGVNKGKRQGPLGNILAFGTSRNSAVVDHTAASVVLVGLLLGGAWWQARGTRPVGVTEREQLAAEIARQDAAAGGLQRENAALAVEIDSERARQLKLSEQGGLAEEVERLGLVTGAVAAVGPGVVVTLDDAVSVKPGGGSDPRQPQQNDDGRVLDRDLQLVVNGLWDAGAEAAAINGQRLTALSAIRSAGLAILVDYRPLSPPYRITAIGDPATLQTRFSAGPGGRDLQYLKDNFGVRVEVASVKRAEVPANAGLDVRRAQAVAPRPALSPDSLPQRQQETP